MNNIVPCSDIPSKTTNVSVDRYTIPDTSCYCIGHTPTSYRMLLYRAWCCQIVINVRRSWSASHPIKLFPIMLLHRLRCATLWAVCQDMLITMPLHRACTTSSPMLLYRMQWSLKGWTGQRLSLKRRETALCRITRLTVVCETKWSETKRNETKWNETKWKSVVCEMRICSLRNENL